MPGRGRSSFNKRQKEMSRQEKRREKAARKQQRKLEKQSALLENGGDSASPEAPGADLSQAQNVFSPDLEVTPDNE
jgi:hypothetical protein